MKTPLSNECCRLVEKFCLSALFFACHSSFAEDPKPESRKEAVPIIKDGETQIAPRFKDPDMWIRHDLWVETGFDSDGDGKKDRMHVDVTRPRQTDTEGLKVPVIYNSSPYFAGTAKPVHSFMWDTRHELGVEPPKR